jgi:hypothetical protein
MHEPAKSVKSAQPGVKQFAGHLQHPLAGQAGAQQQSEQFGVAEGARPAREQFFAGAGIGGQIE